LDLHFAQAEETEAERSVIDLFMAGNPSKNGLTEESRLERPRSRARRELLLPGLHALQSGIGWISHGALNYLCEALSVPPADAFGVASFYSMLALSEQAPDVLHVCDDIACRSNGAMELIDECERVLGPGGTGEAVGWRRSPCLGRCDRAPAVFVQRTGTDNFDHGPVHADLSGRLIDGLAELARMNLELGIDRSTTPQGPAEVRLLRRIVEGVDPASLESYRAHGGYTALERALAMGPANIRALITASGLTGRGGAGFPTGRKWDMAAAEPAPRYVVANADESEPGTFKDRLLIEEDPFALIESLTIAAIAVGASKGFVYLRGEYPLARQRLAAALVSARSAGLLGDDILGTGASFEIELRVGAGAYICGEETALFNSIEGYRGEPRNKPPYPTQVGLFGRPTVVNNVETLLNVPVILTGGTEAYRELGTDRSTGTKIFAISGHVGVPGVYEVPFGTPLQDLLALAGGMRIGSSLGSVLLGGAAGTFIGPDALEMPLANETAAEHGASLGSGAVVVFDTGTDMADIVARIAAFFRHESCGRCAPCRIGTVRQEELLVRARAGFDAAPLIREVGQAMTDASICGLGQTAANAVRSAIDLGLLRGGT
jgi:NADH-quinone oxidoreductase subunit F